MLATERATLGDRHPVLATTLNSLSRVLIELHRFDEAASGLEEALDIARASLGNDHQLVAIYSHQSRVRAAGATQTRGSRDAAA